MVFGLVQGGFGIAGKERNRKNVKHRRIGKKETIFDEGFLFKAHQSVAAGDHAGYMLYFRKLLEHCFGQRGGGIGHGKFIVAKGPDYSYAVNAVGFFMKAVVAEFVNNKQQDDDTGGQTNGQPGNIDKREAFVAEHAAERSEDEVLYHWFFICDAVIYHVKCEARTISLGCSDAEMLSLNAQMLFLGAAISPDSKVRITEFGTLNAEHGTPNIKHTIVS